MKEACIINKDVWEHTCHPPGWTQGKQPKAVMARLDLTILLLMLSVQLEVTDASLTQFLGATAPGDIIIGGLFPIHEAVTAVNINSSNSFSSPQRPTCSRWVFILENPGMKVRKKSGLDWTDHFCHWLSLWIYEGFRCKSVPSEIFF